MKPGNADRGIWSRSLRTVPTLQHRFLVIQQMLQVAVDLVGDAMSAPEAIEGEPFRAEGTEPVLPGEATAAYGV